MGGLFASYRTGVSDSVYSTDECMVKMFYDFGHDTLQNMIKFFANGVNFSINNIFSYLITETVEILWKWQWKVFGLKIRRCKIMDKNHAWQEWARSTIWAIFFGFSTFYVLQNIEPYFSFLISDVITLIIIQIYWKVLMYRVSQQIVLIEQNHNQIECCGPEFYHGHDLGALDPA